MRASTPSNAAELLTPDKKTEKRHVRQLHKALNDAAMLAVETERRRLDILGKDLNDGRALVFRTATESLALNKQLLNALDPYRPLERGYAIVRNEAGATVTRTKHLSAKESVTMQFADGIAHAKIVNKEEGTL